MDQQRETDTLRRIHQNKSIKTDTTKNSRLHIRIIPLISKERETPCAEVINGLERRRWPRLTPLDLADAPVNLEAL